MGSTHFQRIHSPNRNFKRSKHTLVSYMRSKLLPIYEITIFESKIKSQMDWASIESDVIGIGEECHGDLISWKWRIDAVRSLANSSSRRVAVLLENFDYYVKSSRDAEFEFETRYGKFYPNLLFGSDVKKEHKQSCREIAKHATCFGVDVQQLSKEHSIWSWETVKSQDIIGKVLGRHRSSWLSATESDRHTGALRNELNAKIVIDMNVALRAVGFTSVLYFAQNEHIGTSSFNHSNSYFTDGYYISKSKKMSYTAVATCGPRIWNTWHGKPRLHRCKIPKSGPCAKKPIAIVWKSQYPYPLEMLNYTSDAFDVVIVDHSEQRFG